jgi:hypothetical protein
MNTTVTGGQIDNTTTKTITERDIGSEHVNGSDICFLINSMLTRNKKNLVTWFEISVQMNIIDRAFILGAMFVTEITKYSTEVI